MRIMRRGRPTPSEVGAPPHREADDELRFRRTPDRSLRDFSGIPVEASGEPVPPALFDRKFYRATYEDATAPRDHFAQRGRVAGAAPSRGALHLVNAIRMRATVSPTPMSDIVQLLPESERDRAADEDVWRRLRACSHPALYAAQFDESERADILNLTVDEVFDHFLAFGAHSGKRVCALYNNNWYIERLEAGDLDVPTTGNRFFHWLTFGWDRRIVPTPLFDETFYVRRHSWLESYGSWVFEHYLTRGCYQTNVTPSPTGRHHSGVEDPSAKQTHNPLLMREFLHHAERYDLAEDSWLEEGCRYVLSKVARLNSERMQTIIEKAAAIEPLIHRPSRKYALASAPPHRHSRLLLADRAEAVRKAVGTTHVDTIVLVPHCRMAGSARVAGELTRALSELDPASSVILVTTDLSTFERPDWFHPAVPIFDLAAHAEGLNDADRLDLLLDLVRGLTPARIVNVNSKLGWELLTAFGRQLSAEASLAAYLFTWDLNSDGHKVGYPIRQFQDCFAHLDVVLFDNATLRQEIIDRYLLAAEDQDRLVVARTPLVPTEIDLSGEFERRRESGEPLRAMWAGRFDRQKRFDVVVEIAELMPELEILAWGKPVLNDLAVDLDRLPPNITLQGTYSDFDELPLREVDFMIYTAAWDGIPTLLLDAAARGIPIVASGVGGIPEVVSNDTGYLVPEATDPCAFVNSIKQLIDEPARATSRSKALRRHVATTFSEENYRDQVRRISSSRTNRNRVV